ARVRSSAPTSITSRAIVPVRKLRSSALIAGSILRRARGYGTVADQADVSPDSKPSAKIAEKATEKSSAKMSF
ncbi:MAG: hypothetical protein OEP45_15170, partial [Acidobacteriota bacterium]|nr:hypothetical protein [Acidobacteriota bacterium]